VSRTTRRLTHDTSTMIFALQTLTDKFYMGNVVSGPNALDTIKMTEILFGGRDTIEKTPATISLINCNSPLRWTIACSTHSSSTAAPISPSC